MNESAPWPRHGPLTDSTRELAVGTKVCVWNQFLEQWSGGFEVADVDELGYHLRRLSDGHVLEDRFPLDDVLPDRRRNPMRAISGSYLDRRHDP